MSSNLGKMILEDFLKHSKPCIDAVVKEMHKLGIDKEKKVHLLEVTENRIKDVYVEGNHLFLRVSVEYSYPQLTLEELQGIVASRLIEVCANYFFLHGFHELNAENITELCNMLEDPPRGRIVPYLLNTDDTEPDRYSLNPLRESLIKTGQTAFPAAYVITDELKIDEKFLRKYEGSLISKSEAQQIENHLKDCNGIYVNLVDIVKQERLRMLSELFRINLCLPIMRMPLNILEKENTDDLMHHIIKEVHKNRDSIEKVYDCMGRSMNSRTTLLTVPHSKKGYGSKRAARGKIYLDGEKLKSIRVTYKTTPLYPNSIDQSDVSIAEAEDQFIVLGEKLVDYNFKETPSSPQFILYSLCSPEDIAIWHGVGYSGAAQLVKSYLSMRSVCARDTLIENLEKYNVVPKSPLQLNLIPKNMWVHPIYRNIDSSVGCVEDLNDLAKLGMKIEILNF